jgi:hypothetical protein
MPPKTSRFAGLSLAGCPCACACGGSRYRCLPAVAGGFGTTRGRRCPKPRRGMARGGLEPPTPRFSVVGQPALTRSAERSKKCLFAGSFGAPSAVASGCAVHRDTCGYVRIPVGLCRDAGVGGTNPRGGYCRGTSSRPRTPATANSGCATHSPGPASHGARTPSFASGIPPLAATELGRSCYRAATDSRASEPNITERRFALFAGARPETACNRAILRLATALFAFLRIWTF